LLKHLLAHCDGLEAQCRDLLDPGLEQRLQAAMRERTHERQSFESAYPADDAPPA